MYNGFIVAALATDKNVVSRGTSGWLAHSSHTTLIMFLAGLARFLRRRKRLGVLAISDFS